MAGQRLERADERHRGQGVVRDIIDERAVVLQFGFLGWFCHDAEIAGQGIADAAIGVERQRHAIDRVCKVCDVAPRSEL